MKNHILSRTLVCGLVLSLAGASSALAGDVQGRLGLGATLSRDISVSYGISDAGVIEGGIGLSSRAFGDDRNTDFVIGGSYRHTLKEMERVDFNLLAGLSFINLDNQGTVITPMVGFHALFWLTNSVTLGASHGIAIDLNSPDEGDSSTDFGTFSSNFTEMEFTVWFDSK